MFQSIDFPRKEFFEGLPFLLSLICGLSSEFFFLVPKIFITSLFGFHFCPERLYLLISSMQVELQSVKLLPGVVKLFLGFNAIGDSLLILSEKDVVFDLDIF